MFGLRIRGLKMMMQAETSKDKTLVEAKENRTENEKVKAGNAACRGWNRATIRMN